MGAEVADRSNISGQLKETSKSNRMSSCHTRIACHGKAASPVVGRAVYAFIPEVSFSCPLMLLRWQFWLTCKASSSKNNFEKK